MAECPSPLATELGDGDGLIPEKKKHIYLT